MLLLINYWANFGVNFHTPFAEVPYITQRTLITTNTFWRISTFSVLISQTPQPCTTFDLHILQYRTKTITTPNNPPHLHHLQNSRLPSSPKRPRPNRAQPPKQTVPTVPTVRPSTFGYTAATSTRRSTEIHAVINKSRMMHRPKSYHENTRKPFF